MNKIPVTGSSGCLGKLIVLTAGLVSVSFISGCGLAPDTTSPDNVSAPEQDLAEPTSTEQVSLPTPDVSLTPDSTPTPPDPDPEETATLEPTPGEDGVKFGYAEAERKQIFMEIVSAEDRATNEAEFLFPPPDPLSASYSEEAALGALNNQVSYYDEFAPQYRAQVAQRFALSIDQLDEIVAEGVTNEWPFPDLPTPIAG